MLVAESVYRASDCERVVSRTAELFGGASVALDTPTVDATLAWDAPADTGATRRIVAVDARTTAGVAPFAVLFGNVDNVAVEVDGSAYPVSSSNPGSRMARLTINNQ